MSFSWKHSFICKIYNEIMFPLIKKNAKKLHSKNMILICIFPSKLYFCCVFYYTLFYSSESYFCYFVFTPSVKNESMIFFELLNNRIVFLLFFLSFFIKRKCNLLPFKRICTPFSSNETSFIFISSCVVPPHNSVTHSHPKYPRMKNSTSPSSTQSRPCGHEWLKNLTLDLELLWWLHSESFWKWAAVVVKEW